MADGDDIYAACFTQAALANDVLAIRNGYAGAIDYLLDDGNAYKADIEEGYRELRALQAADMISWTVRRTSDGRLPLGFEPLADLLAQYHFVAPYKEQWMQSVAENLRQKA